MTRASPVTGRHAPERATGRAARTPTHERTLGPSLLLPLLAAGNRAVGRYLETTGVVLRPNPGATAQRRTDTTVSTTKPLGGISGSPSTNSALQRQIGYRAVVHPFASGVVQRQLEFTDYDERPLKTFTDPETLLAWARQDTADLDGVSDELSLEAARQLIESGRKPVRVDVEDLANRLMRMLRAEFRKTEGNTNVGTIEHPHHRRYGEEQDLVSLGGPSGVDQDTAGEEGNWKKVFQSAAIVQKDVAQNSNKALDALESMARDDNIRAIVIAGARTILDRRITIRVFNRRVMHSTFNTGTKPDAEGQWEPRNNTLYLAGDASADGLARTWLHELTHQVLSVVVGNDSRPNPEGEESRYDLLDEWEKVSKGFSSKTSDMLRAKMRIAQNEESFDSTLRTISKSAEHLFKDYNTRDLRLRELYSHFTEIYGELYVQLGDSALVRRVMDLQLPACSAYFAKRVMPQIKQFAALRLATRLQVEL